MMFEPANYKIYNKTFVTSKDQPVHQPNMAGDSYLSFFG